MVGRFLRRILRGGGSPPDSERMEREQVRLIIRGTDLVNEGDLDGAIEAFDAAIAVDPSTAIAYRQRGITYLHRQDFTRAVFDFDEALRLKPDDAETHVERGVAHSFLGDFQRAERDYSAAIGMDPYLHSSIPQPRCDVRELRRAGQGDR